MNSKKEAAEADTKAAKTIPTSKAKLVDLGPGSRGFADELAQKWCPEMLAIIAELREIQKRRRRRG